MIKKILKFFRPEEVAPVPMIKLEPVIIPCNELEGEQRKGFCMAMDSLMKNPDFRLLIKSLQMELVDKQLNGEEGVLPNEPLTTTKAELARVALNTLHELMSTVEGYALEMNNVKTQDEDDIYI